MAVAPGIFQRMPDSLRRWAMMALHPASTVPEPMNAVVAEVAVAHAVGVGFEVGQRFSCVVAGGVGQVRL